MSFCSRNIYFLIDNLWTKCTVWQRLMGWSKKKAGRGKQAIENDECNPAVSQGRRFLELLLIWSRFGRHPGKSCVLFMETVGITHSSSVEKRACETTAELTDDKEFGGFKVVGANSINFTCIVKYCPVSILAMCVYDGVAMSNTLS